MDISPEDRVANILQHQIEAAPAGYAIALHVRYSTPTFLFQSYDPEWTQIYSHQGLVLKDPTVAWAFLNTGTTRWSALDDPAGMLSTAAEHGLRYGVTVSLDEDGSKTMGSYAHDSREFTDDEVEGFVAVTKELHALTADIGALRPETAQRLKKMSIDYVNSARR